MMIETPLSAAFESRPAPEAVNDGSALTYTSEETKQLLDMMEKHNIILLKEELDDPCLFERRIKDIVPELLCKVENAGDRRLLIAATVHFLTFDQVQTIGRVLQKTIAVKDLVLPLLWNAAYAALPEGESTPIPRSSEIEIKKWLQEHREVCSAVKSLNLSHCSLPGLPPEISYFKGINELALKGNAIGKKIKEAVALLEEMPSLRVLDLERNDIRVLPSLSRLTSLEELNLSRNPITAGVPRKLNVRKITLAETVGAGVLFHSLSCTEELTIDKAAFAGNCDTILLLKNLQTLTLVHEKTKEKYTLKDSRILQKLKQLSRSIAMSELIAAGAANYKNECSENLPYENVLQSYARLPESSCIKEALNALLAEKTQKPQAGITQSAEEASAENLHNIKAKLLAKVALDHRKMAESLIDGCRADIAIAILDNFLNGALDPGDVPLLLLWKAIKNRLTQYHLPPSYNPKKIRSWLDIRQEKLLQIDSLDLSNCGLSTLPVEVRYLKKLTCLILRENKFNAFSLIKRNLACFETLERLDLSKNPLQVLTGLAAFSNLVELNLNKITLQKRLPYELMRLTKLRDLAITHTINGELFIAQLSKVEKLAINAAALTQNYGVILKLPQLRVLVVKFMNGEKTYEIRAAGDKKLLEDACNGNGKEAPALVFQGYDKNSANRKLKQEIDDWNKLCEFQKPGLFTKSKLTFVSLIKCKHDEKKS